MRDAMRSRREEVIRCDEVMMIPPPKALGKLTATGPSEGFRDAFPFAGTPDSKGVDEPWHTFPGKFSMGFMVGAVHKSKLPERLPRISNALPRASSICAIPTIETIFWAMANNLHKWTKHKAHTVL
ncbi:hypothetical protein [Bifidobacterium vansinderenii]|uniref:hypothetical protein n=1 Tax=Bifidobacterium vansinderenii TaxID=1984871 RepID=UPI001E3036CA|nr:hypothetical protein [Bifidobacterium vansinderenii]